MRDRLGNRDLDLRVAADIGRNRQHPAARSLGAELAGRRVEPPLIGRRDRDRRALREQRPRSREADPARAAGDERDLAGKWTHRSTTILHGFMTTVCIIGAGDLGGALRTRWRAASASRVCC